MTVFWALQGWKKCCYPTLTWVSQHPAFALLCAKEPDLVSENKFVWNLELHFLLHLEGLNYQNLNGSMKGIDKCNLLGVKFMFRLHLYSKFFENTLAWFIFTGVEWDGASSLLYGKMFYCPEYILGIEHWLQDVKCFAVHWKVLRGWIGNWTVPPSFLLRAYWIG